MDSYRLIPDDCPVAAVRYQAGGVRCKATEEALENKYRRGIRVVVLAVVFW